MRLAYINGQHYIPISTDKKYECRANIWKQPILTSNTSALPKFAVNWLMTSNPAEMAYIPFSGKSEENTGVITSDGFLVISFERPVALKGMTITTSGHQFVMDPSLQHPYLCDDVTAYGVDKFNPTEEELINFFNNSCIPTTKGTFSHITEDGKTCKAVFAESPRYYVSYAVRIRGSQYIEMQAVNNIILDAEEF